jgi:hypothetical protein
MARVSEEEYQRVKRPAVGVEELEPRGQALDKAALEHQHEQRGDGLDASRGILLGLTTRRCSGSSGSRWPSGTLQRRNSGSVALAACRDAGPGAADRGSAYGTRAQPHRLTVDGPPSLPQCYLAGTACRGRGDLLRVRERLAARSCATRARRPGIRQAVQRSHVVEAREGGV